MQSVVSASATSVDVSGSGIIKAFAVAGSVKHTTAQTSTSTEQLASASFVRENPQYVISLKMECAQLEHLNARILEAFKNLPRSLDPTGTGRFDAGEYLIFLNNHGTHIVHEVVLGSRYEYWSTSKGTAETDLEAAKTKACAKASMLKPSKNNAPMEVDGCVHTESATTEEGVTASNTETTVVWGSTGKARDALVANPNAETFEVFFEEARSVRTPNPSSYKYTPIWTVLSTHFKLVCACGCTLSCAEAKCDENLVSVPWAHQTTVSCVF